jgi:GMP synthase (glutamine-hydrolysing)
VAKGREIIAVGSFAASEGWLFLIDSFMPFGPLQNRVQPGILTASHDRADSMLISSRRDAKEPPMPSEVVVLQHVGCETIGSIQAVLAAKQVAVRVVRLFKGEPVPKDLGAAGGLIVMGGPMGVYDHDRFPFLLHEMRLIEATARADKPVLGICLGSQLLAAALGATVKPSGRQEIGWHEVTLAPAAESDELWSGVPSKFMAVHWHGDIFDLPASAQLLASSQMTAHQAFRYGPSAYGLLFHMEVTAGGLDGMAAAFPGDLEKVGLTRAALLEQSQHYLPGLQTIGEQVFQRWVQRLI